MLPAGRAHRMVSILSQALEDCAVQTKKLEDNLILCWSLLGDWKVQTSEGPKPEDDPRGGQESEPSPQELEELELLNRALKRALRVRKSTLQSPLKALGAAEEEKAAKKKPTTSTAGTQQAPCPKENVPKTIKVISVSKNAASSKKSSGYTLKAPYRTDPVKAPTHQSSRAPKMTVKALAKQVRKTAAATGVHQEVFCAAAEPSGSHKSPPCEQQSSSFFGCSASDENPVAANVDDDCPGSLAESQVTQNQKVDDLPVESTTAWTFTLREKGSLLKLPLPYRKAYSRNSRLWEKCRLCQSNSAAVSARNHFLEKMQATFCSSAPALSPAEIEEEVMVLCDAHSLLSQCMETEATSHPTWEREYESLLTLEGLQDTASQCLHKLQELQAAAESHVKLQPSDCTHSTGTSASLRGRRCGNTCALATPLLFYSSVWELQEITSLKLQVAMLRQQIDIQKVLMAELLPLVESRLPQDDSLSQLYRAVYTQLCEGGEQFPVLVNDELPD